MKLGSPMKVSSVEAGLGLVAGGAGVAAAAGTGAAAAGIPFAEIVAEMGAELGAELGAKIGCGVVETAARGRAARFIGGSLAVHQREWNKSKVR
jgi:hypothetical protein